MDGDEMSTFSLLSLNTFGVQIYINGWRLKRMAAEINRLAPSVICLQEIQKNSYISLLERSLPDYPQHAFSKNRFAPMGGLFTAWVSGCAMVKKEFFPYPNRGRLLSIGFSDWALHKGVLVVTLEMHGRRIIVMNTHLQANYRGNWLLSNFLAQIELDQVDYLAGLIHAQPRDAWIFVCGDFNFPRQTSAYQQMVSMSGLIDPLASDPRPTYQPFPFVSPKKWLTTLDYIFYRSPGGDGEAPAVDIIPIKNSSARRPVQRFLTDHHALLLSLSSN